MSSLGSVTAWIDQLKVGDEAAAHQIWASYFQRLVGLARQRLYGTARAVADEEDVVLSAFDSFFRGAQQGRFPRLSDRDDLWQLLVLITKRKTVDLVQFNGRKKRDGAATQSLEQLRGAEAGGAAADLAALISADPTPDFAAQLAEETQRLFALLGSEDLRQVALWKMEGDTNREIAAKLGCVERTVERKLWLIKKLWETAAGIG
jgi:DNA-directed RNA polymerase specialized sigma24 family protein